MAKRESEWGKYLQPEIRIEEHPGFIAVLHAALRPENKRYLRSLTRKKRKK